MIWVAEATFVHDRVDGDTVHSKLDIGWGITLMPRLGKRPGPGTLRLVTAGGGWYDAPERDTKRGKEAREAFNALLPPVAVIHSHKLDAFGRTLASVDLPDGRDLATVMIEMGYVK